MRLFLDTSAYSFAMRGENGVVSLLREAEELIMCPITTGELFAGFARGSKEIENHKVFKEFLKSPRVRIVPITTDTSVFYAKILNDLRAIGKPIPSNDIWIAACAMQEGAQLLSSDRHFQAVPGLLFKAVP